MDYSKNMQQRPGADEMPSLKGIPENLKALAARGERVRFNGFWLGESPQERAIARWIDDTPQAAVMIKAILFAAITGNGLNFTPMQATDESYADEIEIGQAGNALLDFDD